MSDYNKLKLAELKELTTKRGMDVSGLKRKQPFIDALNAADLRRANKKPSVPTKSPTAVEPRSEPQDDLPEHGIDFGLDYGTWKHVTAYVFSHKGKRIGLPAPLSIGHHGHEQRMMATWIDNEFIHGHELEQRANEDSTLSDTIIDYWKLPLYRHTKTSAHTDRVNGILEEFGKTLDDLLYEHLKAIWGDIKANIVDAYNTFQLQFSEAELQDILNRARVRITVPQMWGLDARRRMQVAAKKAGMKIVVLSYEPQCALSYLMDKEAQKQVSAHRQLHKPDCILVADIGCGTADFVNYELENDLGINSKLKSTGQSSGDLCGSLAVDELLFETLRKRKGRPWMVDTARKLNVTERDLRRRALLAIEEIKTKGGGPATIRGIGQEAYLAISITKAEVTAALDTVIGEIIKHIDGFVEERKPTVLAVTGGFSRSVYLMKTLKGRYDPQGIAVICPDDTFGQCYPVAMGALLRYDSITPPKSMPSRFSYALCISEPFFKELHRDSCTVEYEGTPQEKVIHKPCVMPSLFDKLEKEYVVHNRIRNIIRKGNIIEEGRIIRHELDLEYWIPCENPRICAYFVILQKSFEDHAAAMDYDQVTEEYSFRRGVHEWATVEIPIPRHLLHDKGFETLVAHNEHFWLVNARVTTRYRGEDLRIGFEIIKPSTLRDKGEDNSDPVAFSVEDTVWEAGHDEFMD